MKNDAMIREKAVEFLLLQRPGSFFALGLLDLRRARGDFLVDSLQGFASCTGFLPKVLPAGLTVRSGNTRLILYDASQPLARRNFTIAHEIGHLLLCHSGEETKHAREEREANRFAAEVLLPRIAVAGWERREGQRMDAEEMRRQFSASLPACRRRREELDRDPLPVSEAEAALSALLFSALPGRRGGEMPHGPYEGIGSIAARRFR